jgi:dTMP kinase
MNKGSPGHFISIEGIEGCGKSTQAALLRDWLEVKGLQVLLAREPGGPAISEKIRGILLDPANVSMDHRTELLLYLASRSQFVQELLLPALHDGKIVLVDRYVDSTLAYQGYGRGLDVKDIELMNSFASRDIVPELTFLLDLDPVKGLERKGMGDGKESKGDRLEMESLEFHRKVREGFLSIARLDPDRVVVVRAEKKIEEISSEIQKVCVERFGL